MSTDSPPASKGLLARGLKLVGRLTSPETRTGRVFTRAERGLTKISARLSESPTWLRLSGGLMRQGFNLRIRRHALQERALLALRLPAASEVEALRDQVRQLNNKMEALGSQIELMVDLLERQERPAKAERRPQEAPAPERVPRRHGT
jgi:hypothetical protein